MYITLNPTYSSAGKWYWCDNLENDKYKNQLLSLILGIRYTKVTTLTPEKQGHRLLHSLQDFSPVVAAVFEKEYSQTFLKYHIT